MNPKIHTAIHFLEANYQQKVSLRRLAKSLHLSPSRFCVLFKTETGVSPQQHLKCLRLTRACQLLADSFLPIKAVAYEVGYPDSNYFMREFKKHYGQTPSQYRARRVKAALG